MLIQWDIKSIGNKKYVCVYNFLKFLRGKIIE